MATQANTALLRPFREVMKWASLAAVHAQDSANDAQQGAQLQRSSSALLRDAERAVKRLTPYLESPTPELSAFLTDLVLRNADVIAEYRAVDILLYDFEDYIEASSYEAEKFTALQSAIKTLALLLLERIQRFTTETALDGAPPSLRPLPALPVRANISKTVTAQSNTPRAPPPPPSVPEEPSAPVVVVPPSERKASLPRQVLPASKFASAQAANVQVTEIRPERERPERPARPDRPEDLPDLQSDYGFSKPDYRPRYGSATSPDGTFVGLDRVDLGSPISMGSLASLGRPGSAASVRTSQTSDTSLSSSRRDYP